MKKFIVRFTSGALAGMGGGFLAIVVSSEGFQSVPPTWAVVLSVFAAGFFMIFSARKPPALCWWSLTSHATKDYK